MAIKVLTVRKFKKDRIEDGHKLLRELRAAGTLRSGFVSGQTLISVEEPHKLLVISTWTDIKGWEAWQASNKRKEIALRITELLEASENVEIFYVGQRESEADLA
ncbi:MAG: antibiotic biosynthesis monooxygenase [Desulfomonile tiedjei]|uniref:Antibiotic biosynthesis monooxygenase n=1 Tax=Desulfomonile tiedjei TaxID=2358 RepID=A0A9D6V885_9BACT|nr:antibiotic biosynthesis monooxygenase [Desulfomonile tiedjei]